MARNHPYAPMHAVKHHPLASWLHKMRKDPVGTRIETFRAYQELSQFRQASNEFEAIAFSYAKTSADGGRIKSSLVPGYMEDTSETLRSLGLWMDMGQKIYEFGEELTQELLETDIHDVTAGDLKPPMRCFYMAFDMDKPYVMPNGKILDGVMIDAIVDDAQGNKGTNAAEIHIIFMARAGKYEMDKTNISVTIPLKNEDDSLQKSFDEVLTRYEQMYIEGKKQWGGNEAMLDDALANMEVRFAVRRTLFSDLYRLIAGGLLYLSVYHDRGEEGWSPSAPQKFVSKLSGLKAEAHKAQAWLADKGWSRATYFNVSRSTPSGEPTGSTVATHWRRGHWRRQAVGPNRCERRITWIRPMLVNADAGPIQAKTQIVAVGKPQA